jgi:hypothetical protein
VNPYPFDGEDGRPCVDASRNDCRDRLLTRLIEAHGPDGRPDIAAGAIERDRAWAPVAGRWLSPP